MPKSSGSSTKPSGKQKDPRNCPRESSGMRSTTNLPLPRADAWLVRALVATSLLLFFPRAAAADDFRVEDAVKLALANNERSKKAPLRVEAAEGQLARARAG